MRYTRRRPKVAGWYWVRTDKSPDTIKKVSDSDQGLSMVRTGGGGNETVALQYWIEEFEEYNLQFAGPIPQPKDIK